MSPILLLFRSMVKLERLKRFAMDANKDYAPMSPILLLFISRVKLERLRRFAMEDNKY